MFHFLNFDILENVEKAKCLERPLERNENFKLCREKKDRVLVSAVIANYFVCNSSRLS